LIDIDMIKKDVGYVLMFMAVIIYCVHCKVTLMANSCVQM